MANELVKMADVLRHLDLSAGDTTNATELQLYIDAATPIVEYITGPINTYTYTNEAYPVGGTTSRLSLRHVPVQTVTNVIEYVGITPFTLTSQPPGSTHDNYGYYLQRPEAGTLVRMSSFGQESPFLGTWIMVTYAAGLTSIPPDVKLAVLEDIAELYDQRHNGGRKNFAEHGNEAWGNGPAHMFPRLAAMLENRARVQSIA